MNTEPFLRVIDGPAPSGSELRNEPEFQAIVRMMEPASREARTDDEGNISLSSDVDWSALLSDAEALADKGRDLRLMVLVVRAWTNIEGFSGLAAGLELITEALRTFWDSIHPELRDRPDPAEAALRRRNAIKQIENDDNGLLGDLEMMVVLNPRGVGPIRGGDLAQGSRSEFEFMSEAPSGLNDGEEATLRARHASVVSRVKTACRALAAETPDEARKLADDIAAAISARETLERTFTEKAGLANGTGFRLAELARLLDRAAASLDAALEGSGDDGAAEDEAMAETTGPPETAAVPATGAAPAAGAGAPQRVNSRRDVENCLDMIIDFYERTEPSSPIPHLARRMRRMVPMDFMQLMEEIAPSGMKEFKSVAGVDEKRKNE